VVILAPKIGCLGQKLPGATPHDGLRERCDQNPEPELSCSRPDRARVLKGGSESSSGNRRCCTQRCPWGRSKAFRRRASASAIAPADIDSPIKHRRRFRVSAEKKARAAATDIFFRQWDHDEQRADLLGLNWRAGRSGKSDILGRVFLANPARISLLSTSTILAIGGRRQFHAYATGPSTWSCCRYSNPGGANDEGGPRGARRRTGPAACDNGRPTIAADPPREFRFCPAANILASLKPAPCRCR